MAPNALQRDFTATAPNQRWLADISYVATAQGWLYVALVLDLYARIGGTNALRLPAPPTGHPAQSG